MSIPATTHSPSPSESTSSDYFISMVATRCVVRISLIALGALIVNKGGSLIVVGILGMIVSTPAFLTGVGGVLAYKGSLAVISAVATGSLTALAGGLIAVPVGCFFMCHILSN